MLGCDSTNVLECHPVKADDTRCVHSMFMTTAITRSHALPVYQCCVAQLSASAQKASGSGEPKLPRPPLRMVVTPGTPRKRYSLRPTPFTRRGVGAHILRTSSQTREPE
jgi:hypothetical protein